MAIIQTYMRMPQATDARMPRSNLSSLMTDSGRYPAHTSNTPDSSKFKHNILIRSDGERTWTLANDATAWPEPRTDPILCGVSPRASGMKQARIVRGAALCTHPGAFSALCHPVCGHSSLSPFSSSAFLFLHKRLSRHDHDDLHERPFHG